MVSPNRNNPVHVSLIGLCIFATLVSGNPLPAQLPSSRQTDRVGLSTRPASGISDAATATPAKVAGDGTRAQALKKPVAAVTGTIGLGANTIVGLGQSSAFPITLSAPAPDDGVTATLTSSDPSIVNVTSTVFISGGRTSPNVQPKVTGLNLGAATISASAPNYSTTSQAVQVTALLSFAGKVTIIAPATQSVLLTLSGPAPAAGLVVNLISDDTEVATVPPNVTFPAGATSVSVAITGLEGGATAIHASAPIPNLTGATLDLNVVSTGSIIWPQNATVGVGSSVTLPLAISAPAPKGGLTVALTSDHATYATVTPATVFIPAGTKTPATQPQANGVREGNAIVVASAPGFASAGVYLTIGPPSPALLSVDPNTGLAGQQNLSVDLTGQSTHWVQGTTTVSFGPGITVKQLTVKSPISATAVLNINGTVVTPTGNVGQPNPGYAATNFVTGFANTGAVGPIGLAFDASGVLYVMDTADGFLYKFASGGGIASAATRINATPISGAPTGLTFGKDGKLYLARQSANDVVQLDPATGIIVRTLATNIQVATGIATDPLSGDLFVSRPSTGSNSIVRISNFSAQPGTVTVYSPVAGVDGLAFVPDGTLYAAIASLGQLAKISATNSLNPGATTILPGTVSGLDGIAISALPGTPFVYVNNNNGTITKVDLTVAPPTLTNIFTGGSRGDFVTVGPDGCLYATQTDRIIKVTNADGTCLPPPLGPLFSTDPGVEPGPRTVTVTTNAEVVSLLNGFTVKGAPVLTQVTPNTGQQGQTLPVTIIGQNTHFTNASTIDLGAGITVSKVSATDTTHLTAQLSIPSGAALGTRTLTVTTGTEIVALPQGFTVNPAPVLLSINPSSGLPGVNLPVSLTGQNTHFTDSSVINMGPDILVTNGRAADATHLNAVLAMAASATQGSRPCTVSTGSEVVTLVSCFTVNPPPILLSVSPNNGQQGQTLSVTIAGNFTHFSLSSIVTFGETGVTAATPTSATATSLTVQVTIAPNAIVGPRTVTVTSGAEVASLIGQFSVITGCAVQGPQTFLVPAGVPAGTVSSPLSNRLLAMKLTGLQVKPGDTFIINAIGTASGGPGFPFLDANGASGPVSGGEFPTIVGAPANIYSLIGAISTSDSELIDGSLSWFLVGTQRTITATKAGQVVLLFHDAVYRGNWSPAYLDNSGAFTVTITSPFACPAITTILPNSGLRGQQNLSVAITGQNTHFTALTQVNFGSGGGITVGPVTVIDASHVVASIAIAADATVGPRAVSVTTGTEAVSLANGFTVLPLPQITQVIPNTGVQGQKSLTVSITGQFSNFLQATTGVAFGAGITVSSLTVTSPTNMTAVLNIAPNAPVGPRDLTFTTGAESITLRNGFTVLSGTPLITSTPIIKTTLSPAAQSGQLADLTNWKKDQYILNPSDGPANWVLQPGNTSVIQSAPNPDASIFVSDFQFSCGHIEGSIQVNTDFDDDEIGFVWGYQDQSHLYRFNWKKAAQDNIPQGMGIYVVNANSPLVGDELEIANGSRVRQLFLNSIPWVSFTQYRYILDFIPGQFKISVYQGQLLLESVTISDGTYTSGKFGFYNHSQGVVTHTATRPSSDCYGAYQYQLTATDPLNTALSYFLASGPAGMTTNASTGLIGWSPTFADIGSHGVTPRVQNENGLSTAQPYNLEVLPPNRPPAITSSPVSSAAVEVAYQYQMTASDPDAGDSLIYTLVTAPTGMTITATTGLINWIPAASQAGNQNVRVVVTDQGGLNPTQVFQILVQQAAAPIITQISPNSGQQGQGGPVGIVGQNIHFVQGTTQVDFGAGIVVSNVAVTCATCLTVTLAVAANAAVGPRDVTVTTGSEVVRGTFTVTSGTPILTSVVPNSVQQGQSTSIAITGNFTHFVQGTTQVNFGAGVTVSSVTVSNAGSLVAQIVVDSAAPVSARPVTVTTNGEAVVTPAIFNVNPPTPTLVTINPGGGCVGQPNLTMLITGLATHFAQGTSVATFGAGITVTSLTVSSPTSATAIVNIDPSALIGGRTVTITTSGETASFASGFTVSACAPILLTLNPGGTSQGATNKQVQITGFNTHFVQGTSVASFGAGITVTAIGVTNSTTATATINIDVAAGLGTRTVTVTTGSEIATFTNGFTVVPGVSGITQINPGGAPQGISDLSVDVTAQFTHFVQGTTTANFGSGVTIASLTINSPLTATAVVNVAAAAALGPRDVTFTTASEAVTAPGGFTITQGTPALSLNPNTGRQGQSGLSVTVTGQLTHFVQGSTTLSFGAGIVVKSVNIASAISAVVIVDIDPLAATGLRTVTAVTGPETVSLTNGFGVLPANPVLTQLTPTTGQQGQQNLGLSIFGQFSHFSPGVTQVSLGQGITIFAINVISPTSLTASIGIDVAATPGPRTLAVTTGSETVSLTDGFTVQAVTSGPVSVTPASALQGQTLTVNITGVGSHFVQGSTQARFGPGISVGSALAGDFGAVTVTSPTTATAQIMIVKSALPGSRTVTLQTGPEVDIGSNAFVILGIPLLSGVAPAAANQGASGSVAINGNYTHFAQGSTQVSFGAGITVNSVAVNTSTALTANITVSLGAVPGVRNVSVTTGAENLSAANGFTVLGPVTGPAPVPSITSPQSGDVVSAPTQVTGTVTSSNFAYWRLEYQAPQSSTFVQFATGTVSAVTGIFDPSLMLNGNAQIRLTGVDISGQTSAVAISVVVARNLKIGIFTVSFNDLSIPVAGFPIQVVRTYDSRRAQSSGDFGFGWTLDLKTANVTTNIPLGEGWTLTKAGAGIGTVYCVQESSAHVITVNLADGTTYQFSPSLAGACQQLTPPIQVSVGFAPNTSTGTTPQNAGLKLGNSGPFLLSNSQPGPVVLLDLDDVAPLNPDQFISTLPDGRALQISRQNGLQKLTDLNGNMLTVAATGITHSSGKSVNITRDIQGRITQINDPATHTLNYSYDAVGNLSAFIDQLPETSTYAYNLTHGLVTINDPRGVQPIRNDYDADGRLVSHTDAFGNVINYEHDTINRQEIVTDRLGNITVNQYDSAGNIVKVIDALGGATARQYDANGNVLQETNALTRIRKFTYDINNNRKTEADPLSNTTSYEYNTRNQVVKITDALNRVTTNVYDDLTGNLKSTTDPALGTTSYTYKANGLRTSTKDALGFQTFYDYDGAGNLTKQTDALGFITNYQYDQNGNKTRETRTRTNEGAPETLDTVFTYDNLNRLIQTTYPDGTSSQIQYNLIGKQAVTIDQLGRKTQYAYDLMGRLMQTTYPDLTTDSSTYDAEGHRISSTDRADRKTLYKYDALGHLTLTTLVDGATSSTDYDAIGEVLKSTDALGNVTQYVYDDAGRRTKVIDALLNSTILDYDKVGNQTAVTDANGNKTEYQYDPDNRRVKVIHPDGTADATAYDAVGRTISKTDQAGLNTQYKYDPLGHLILVTDALNQQTQYAYDEVGTRLSQTDANLHTTGFTYDKLGRRVKRKLPRGGVESMTYDQAGNLATKTDFNGKKTTYGYDPQTSRLTSKTPDASFNAPVVRFDYSLTGQRLKMVDASGTTVYTYDNRDRLISKATPNGTLTYTYDFQGNLKTMRSSNANGTSVDYSYDVLNRLAGVKDNRLASGSTAYHYDNAGNLSDYTYPNGVQSALKYDALNRLKSAKIEKGIPLVSYAYTLGLAGNRTQVDELNGRRVVYGYDNLYRLISETISGATSNNGDIGYVYDAVGNRKSRTSTVPAIPSANSNYDDNDRLNSDVYDEDGNTTISSGNTYAYDFENHLIGSSSGGFTAVYDGDGNRVSRTSGGVTTAYLADDRNLTGYAQVLEELSGGVVQQIYTYGLNRISQRQASGTSFYGYDGHGNVRLLTGSTGAVTDRYDYDAFGNILSQAGSTPNVYLYSGEQKDASLGLFYLRARYLSQSTGRFWTTDRMLGEDEEPVSQNKYVFAGNDPINKSDPSGDQFEVGSLTLTIFTNLLPIPNVHVPASFLANVKAKVQELSSIADRIYRGGSATGGNLTPLPRNTDGLSFDLNINSSRIRSGPYISVRPVLFNKLEADPAPDGHVAVRPNSSSGFTLTDWINARPSSLGLSCPAPTLHPLTLEICNADLQSGIKP